MHGIPGDLAVQVFSHASILVPLVDYAGREMYYVDCYAKFTGYFFLCMIES